MNIARRTFIKGAAAMPLVAVQGLAFAANDGVMRRLPTVQEIITLGDKIEFNYDWTEREMWSLLHNCVKEIARTQDQDRDSELVIMGQADMFHIKVANLTDFTLTHTDSMLAVLTMKTSLTTYQLPIWPQRLSSFERFHKQVGNYIVDAVGDSDYDGSDVTTKRIRFILHNEPAVVLENLVG